jgi:hypothetical protein
MPKGASPKREREYEKLEGQFRQEGRYPGREAQVAARIVNQQRAEHGETRDERQQASAGHAPDRDLPIEDYEHLTVDQISTRLERLSASEIRQIRSYETAHRNRKGVLEAIDARKK